MIEFRQKSGVWTGLNTFLKDIWNDDEMSLRQRIDSFRKENMMDGVEGFQIEKAVDELMKISIQSSAFKCLETLCNFGGDVNGFWDQGTKMTFLHHLARTKENTFCMRILLQNGANLDLKDSNGYNPFEIAIMERNVDCLPLMLEFGADISLTYSKKLVNKSKFPDLDATKNYDRFGFEIQQSQKKFPRLELYQKSTAKKAKKREKKWQKMLRKARKRKSGTHYHRKFLSRIRKGVPHNMRRRLWKKLLPIDQLIKDNPQVYDRLLAQEGDEATLKQIDLDVHRTFREHKDFAIRYSPKQISLFNILKAYSIHDKQVGYCQGMSTIVAMILLFLEEEESFWMLHYIMTEPRYDISQLYLPGFPMLHEYFFIHEKMLTKYYPHVKKYFDKLEISSVFYAPKWYLTYFMDVLPFEVAIVLWDVFLFKGKIFMLSAVNGIFDQLQDEVIEKPFEICIPRLQHLTNFDYNIPRLMHFTVKKPIKPKTILGWIGEYHNREKIDEDVV